MLLLNFPALLFSFFFILFLRLRKEEVLETSFRENPRHEILSVFVRNLYFTIKNNLASQLFIINIVGKSQMSIPYFFLSYNYKIKKNLSSREKKSGMDFFYDGSPYRAVQALSRICFCRCSLGFLNLFKFCIVSRNQLQSLDVKMYNTLLLITAANTFYSLF